MSCYDIFVPDLTLSEYRALADFRFQIRRFLQFSAEAARSGGLEPQQHQLLLAVKGLPEGLRPTVSELAKRLQLQHHSVVELIDRLAERGAVRRESSGVDRRETLIRLTSLGEAQLRRLSLAHREELEKMAPMLAKSLSVALRRRRAA